MQRRATDYSLPAFSVVRRRLFQFPGLERYTLHSCLHFSLLFPVFNRNTYVSKGLGSDSNAANCTRHVRRYLAQSVYPETMAFGQERTQLFRDPLTVNVFTRFLFFHLINRWLFAYVWLVSAFGQPRETDNDRLIFCRRANDELSYNITSQNCLVSVAHGSVDAPLSPLKSLPSHLAL